MPKKQSYREIRLILGDQLNLQHSWFAQVDPEVLYVLMEIVPESEYVTHHIQKVLGIFAAMRQFASALQEGGHHVVYFEIDHKDNAQTFERNLKNLVKKYKPKSMAFQEPDEYRLDDLLEQVFQGFEIPYLKTGTEHFYTERYDLQQFFQGKKQLLMETFYRNMRKTHQVLMDAAGKPEAGKWNYDHENRKKIPAKHVISQPLVFGHDLQKIYDQIEKAGINTIGNVVPSNFIWPLNREEALKGFQYFLKNLLPYFGMFQDALTTQSWSVYHSRISFAMNLKMIAPKEMVEMAESYWRANPDLVSIAQVEGFIRQILGWREYMRGIYWMHMPDYASLNFFDAKRKLPDYFWTGDTKMRCVKHAVQQSLNYGYAHHIQRLMVAGNFASLAGVDPDELDQWYLGIYVDAFDWVEITNTRGMSQFADGGIVGTKPYVSSASYVNKMGDYCKGCH